MHGSVSLQRSRGGVGVVGGGGGGGGCRRGGHGVSDVSSLAEVGALRCRVNTLLSWTDVNTH